jgi:hypothetical protein
MPGFNSRASSYLNSMIWYIAARRQDWGREVRDALVAAGESVNARWLDVPPSSFGQGNQTDEERSIAAHECLQDCLTCDAIVLVAEPDLAPVKGGKHVEFGIVLGMGKACHVIGRKENVFHWLTQVKLHEDIPAFIDSL